MKTAVIISDFGSNSPDTELAILHLKRMGVFEHVISLSCSISPFEVRDAAYLLGLYLDEFEEGTIFIVAVDFLDRKNNPHLILTNINNRIILSYNSGLPSLIINAKEYESQIFKEYTADHHLCVQNAFIPILEGKSLAIDTSFIKTSHPPQPSIDGNILKGTIFYFDSYGTAHTNLKKSLIDDFCRNRHLKIHLSRHEHSSKIYNHVAEVRRGSIACFYNSIGYLAIGVNQGNLYKLLGFRRGGPIEIERT